MKFIVCIFLLVLGFSLSSAKTKKNLSHGESVFVKTCSSKSQRTQLTVFYESINEISEPVKIVLSIDGRHITYDPDVRTNPATGAEEQVNCDGACLEIDKKNEQQVDVIKGNETLLSYSLEPEQKRIVIQPGFKSPFPWKEKGASFIYLDCKEFPPQNY